MRWFRTRIRTFEFVFEGQDSGRRRIITDCSNSLTRSRYDVQRCLNARYHEDHTLLWWKEDKSPTGIGGREAGPE